MIEPTGHEPSKLQKIAMYKIYILKNNKHPLMDSVCLES